MGLSRNSGAMGTRQSAGLECFSPVFWVVRSGRPSLAVSGRRAAGGPDAFLYIEMDAHTPSMLSGGLNLSTGGGKVQKIQAHSRASRWIPHVLRDAEQPVKSCHSRQVRVERF